MTMEQDRARLAHDFILDAKSQTKAEQKKLATVVHELTTLIHAAGPVRALECAAGFEIKKKEQSESLMNSLAKQLQRIDPSIKSGADLRQRLRETDDLQRYMHLGREIQSCLVWYRRCIQSILKINPTDEASEAIE